jgi:hypothetical protein
MTGRMIAAGGGGAAGGDGTAAGQDGKEPNVVVSPESSVTAIGGSPSGAGIGKGGAGSGPGNNNGGSGSAGTDAGGGGGGGAAGFIIVYSPNATIDPMAMIFPASTPAP